MSNAFGRNNVFSGSYPLRHDVNFALSFIFGKGKHKKTPSFQRRLD
jgi:hypothetical protein